MKNESNLHTPDMKVLMISRYAEPKPIGGHSIVYRQAKSLKDDCGVDVEILTWPDNDLWTGPVPQGVIQLPPLRVEREGLLYHVFTAPLEWNELTNVIDAAAWEQAVAFGMKLLASVKPDIVHLQHRHGLWWLLDSAQRLGIPTVYSNHDWGMACLRTLLVMGDDTLCNGHVAVDKCSACIMQGRGFIGKVNETFVEYSAGRKLVEFLYHTPLKQALKRHGAVSVPVRERAELNLERAKRILSKLDLLVTPSEFGRQFYSQLGVQPNRVTVMPWFHDPVKVEKTITPDQPFTITYIGRVSPEKGVHLIFDALERLQDQYPMLLRIAGANNSNYCTELKTKYPTKVGVTEVEWLGWTKVEPLLKSTDVLIIPSIWIDNTPMTLIEALSYRVPVIATRVPTIEELVIDSENAYLADFLSVISLADAIRRAISQKDHIRSGRITFPPIKTIKEYLQSIVNSYRSICRPD